MVIIMKWAIKLALLCAIMYGLLAASGFAKNWWHSFTLRDGDRVSYQADTIGCRTDGPQGWTDCVKLPAGGGVITPKSADLPAGMDGYFRVLTGNQVHWIPGDRLITVKP